MQKKGRGCGSVLKHIWVQSLVLGEKRYLYFSVFIGIKLSFSSSLFALSFCFNLSWWGVVRFVRQLILLWYRSWDLSIFPCWLWFGNWPCSIFFHFAVFWGEQRMYFLWGSVGMDSVEATWMWPCFLYPVWPYMDHDALSKECSGMKLYYKGMLIISVPLSWAVRTYSLGSVVMFLFSSCGFPLYQYELCCIDIYLLKKLIFPPTG